MANVWGSIATMSIAKTFTHLETKVRFDTVKDVQNCSNSVFASTRLHNHRFSRWNICFYNTNNDTWWFSIIRTQHSTVQKNIKCHVLGNLWKLIRPYVYPSIHIACAPAISALNDDVYL